MNELYVKATIDVTGATILGVELGNLRGEEEGGDMEYVFQTFGLAMEVLI